MSKADPPTSSPLRILQVNGSDVGGGAERIACDLVRGYQGVGHQSWLMVGRQRGDAPDTLQIPDDRVGVWARTIGGLAAAIRPLSRRIKPLRPVLRCLDRIAFPVNCADAVLGREDFHYPQTRRLLDLPPELPDLLHGHNLHGGYFDLRALPALSRRVPVVLTLHDEWLFTGHCAYAGACLRWQSGCGVCPDLSIYPALSRDGTAANWRIKAAIYRRSRLFVTTPSRWLMVEAEQSSLAAGMAGARVIPNGVDLAVFAPMLRATARRRLGLPDDRPVLLASANQIRSNPFKDWPTLHRAIAVMAERRPEHSAVFIALGESGPPERVGPIEIRFVPFNPEPATVALHYQAADLFLHAAKSENFPTTVLEALACGTPVVATAVGGIPEQIHDLADPAVGAAATGVLVPAGDGEAMADAVIALLADPERRARMGERARADAQARFGLERMVGSYLDWYREVIEVCARPSPAGAEQ